ncbi:hypothetical protein D7V97_09415 [Corallococcus sp. CA053C]|uniref:hypothetical protein n=1 Tax=Corallococcus sp. CA053C TaxID=2316732 RepID=UPI000EA37C2D|nr:hypothetical protein [Corallococcus sp. CA053C]RKH12082.1 hypothetical protein D7V97_09415 [Corallococcus sp. CA053C]
MDYVPEQRTHLYLNQPGDYTGDTWHVAAAMVLNPRVRVLLTVSSDSKEVETAPAIAGYYEAIGLGQRVQRYTGVKLEKVGSVNGKPKAHQHRDTAVMKVGGEQPVGLIYQSTSVILREIATQELPRVRERLQLGLCAGLSDSQEREIQRRANAWLEQLFSSEDIQTVLLINGRMERYNPQHNLDEERFDIIKEAVLRVPGAHFLVMGNRFALKKEGTPAWLKKAHERRLPVPGNDQEAVEDLFDLVGVGHDLDRWRGTAAFWREVANSKWGREKRVKFVGGRSGSTDIAAFMGIDVLSWDHFLPEDIEYLRMRVTAPDLMRVCHLHDGKKPRTPEFFVPPEEALLGPSVEILLRGDPGVAYPTPVLTVGGSKNREKAQVKVQAKKKKNATYETKGETSSSPVSAIVSSVFDVWSSLFLDPHWIPGSGEAETAMAYSVDGRSFPKPTKPEVG